LLQLVGVQISRRRLRIVTTVAGAWIPGEWMMSLDVVHTAAVCMMKDTMCAWSSFIPCSLNLVISWQEHKDKAHRDGADQCTLFSSHRQFPACRMRCEPNMKRHVHACICTRYYMQENEKPKQHCDCILMQQMHDISGFLAKLRPTFGDY
jgi:hypothetical protein